MKPAFGATGAAVRRLARVRPAATTLLVPVPAAAELVDTTGRPAVADRGLPPHVTVLYPFVRSGAVNAALLARLTELIGAFDPFPFSLGRLEHFPGGVVFLAPEPDEPFVALTMAVWRGWPEQPPYSGAFSTIVPHLTVDAGADRAGSEDRVAGRLPVHAEATEVELYGPVRRGRWRRLARFPLGRA